MKNLLVDPVTKEPRWSGASSHGNAKASFALGAAEGLRSGKLTLEKLRDQIVEAANQAWRSTGGRAVLHTLNDVEERLGGTAKSWFYELQRVSQSQGDLDRLIAQEGKGLTQISRAAGAINYQRRKGSSRSPVAMQVRDLQDTLDELRQKLMRSPRLASDAIGKSVTQDLQKYRTFLLTVKSKP